MLSRARIEKKRFLCLVAVLACWLCARFPGTAAGPDYGDERRVEPEKAEFWFPVGEEFHYRLLWGVLRVGEARLATAWVEEDGRRLLSIRGEARTGRLVRNIYPIENYIEVLVDPDTFLPLRYRQRLREGRRRRDETTVFYHLEGRAEHTSHRNGESKTIEINHDTRDLLTFFYIVRRDSMEVDETKEFQVLVDDEIHDLKLIAEEFENVSLPDYGRVRSLRIEPVAGFGEIHERRGRMWGWLSDDDRRVCVRLTGSLPVANVHAVLLEVKGPGGDRWVD